MNENVNYLVPVSEASAEDRSKEGLINSSYQLCPSNFMITRLNAWKAPCN
jgi:hypothetical protein